MTESLLLVAGALLQAAVVLAADPERESSSKTAWKPLFLDEIRMINESRTLSHADKVAKLVAHLGERLAMPPPTDPDYRRLEPGADIVNLITFLAQAVPYTDTEREKRKVALQQAIKGMPVGLDHEKQVTRYLYLALGLAGGDVPEDEFLSFLRDSMTRRSILYVTLRSMSQSNVPIRALPRLLELADHPGNSIQHTGVGPPESKRVYPIRDAVFDCLQKLGIDSRWKKLPPETPEERKNPGLTETIVTVDREALLKKLETWIVSEDPERWRPAIDALRGLKGDDASALIRELLRRETLSHQKRSALKASP